MSKSVQQSEPEILQQVAAGDESAFASLVKAHSAHLYGYVVTLTKRPDYAEEIVQDVFMEIWQARETLVTVRNFRSFVFIISRNLAMNVVKKMARERLRQQDYTNSYVPEGPETEEGNLRISLIEEAIGQLPAQQQKAWTLVRREGKSYQEAADEMGLSRETLNVLRNKAY